MPRRDLAEDRKAMRAALGKTGPLPARGGPPRPGIPALLLWMVRNRRGQQ